MKKRKKSAKQKEYTSPYKIVKTSLSSIIKNTNDIKIINEKVLIVNSTVKYTYQFIKLYYLYNFDKGIYIDVNKTLVRNIMKLFSKKFHQTKVKKIKDDSNMSDIIDYYYNHFIKHVFIDELYDHSGLSTVLDEYSTQIITSFSNHISNNIESFINRYVNVMIDKEVYVKRYTDMYKKYIENKELLDFVTNMLGFIFKENKSIRNKERNEVKYSIKNYTKYNGNFDIFKNLTSLLPERKKKDKNLLYNVLCEPLKYIPLLVHISRLVESKGYRAMVVFPLKKSYIPSYISIGTTSLIQILMRSKMTYYGEYKSYYSKNVKLMSSLIWNIFFRTRKKCFNDNKYKFGNTILTDGFGVSIQLIRKDVKVNKLGSVIGNRKPRNYKEFSYLSNEDRQILDSYKDKNIVGIDPGKQDLIYCTDGKINYKKNGSIKPHIFRYSQNQRRKEIKTKKYREIIKKEKGPTIPFLESLLSKASSKSCFLKNAIIYVRSRSLPDKILEDEYKRELYRRLKWYSYINKQKSEQKMINNFRKEFGNQKETIVCVGNWSENSPKKYNEPTKGKSIRKLFKRNGYRIYLINEYNTSKKNFLTGEDMEKFIKREHPKAKINKRYKGFQKLWHGLLRSKNGKLSSESLVSIKGKSDKKHILLNRDYNGSMNIYTKAKCIVENKKIPSYLTR